MTIFFLFILVLVSFIGLAMACSNNHAVSKWGEGILILTSLTGASILILSSMGVLNL